MNDNPVGTNVVIEVGSVIRETRNSLITVGEIKKRAKGDCRELLKEIKENSRYLWLALDGHISLAEAIAELSSEVYDRLSSEGLDFNLVQKRKISKKYKLKGTALEYWQGKNTEALVVNIYDKISDIKHVLPLAENSTKIRLRVRAINIQKRIVLLLRHIRDG